MTQLLESVARSICRASGANPDQPVYRNGNPESGVLYLKWAVYRAEAEAAIKACGVEDMREALQEIRTYEGYDDGAEDFAHVQNIADSCLDKLDGKR